MSDSAATAIPGAGAEVLNVTTDDVFEGTMTKKPKRHRPTSMEQSGDLFNSTFSRTNGRQGEADVSQMLMTAQDLNGTMKRRKKKRGNKRRTNNTDDYEDDFEDDDAASDAEGGRKGSNPGATTWASVDVEPDRNFNTTINRQGSNKSKRNRDPLGDASSPSSSMIVAMHPNNHQHPEARHGGSGLPPLADRSNSHAGRRGNSTHGERTSSTSPAPHGGYQSDGNVSLPDITKSSRRSKSHHADA